MKSSEVKIFGIILVVALVLVGFAIVPMLGGDKVPPPPPPPPNVNRALLIPAGSHVRGDPKAPIIIVEFSDFQCPSCRDGAPIVREIIEKHPGQVNEVFHHYQAKPEHVFAQILARGAEAAAKQGKFWEMHDLLFSKQKDLTSGTLESAVPKLRECARSLGLDLAKFDAAMEKKDDAPFDKDNELGVKAKVPGTPTYFLIDPQGKVTQQPTNKALKEWGAALR